MIHFEILNSPDKNVLNLFKYQQNQIYIGRTTGDLWVDDYELFPSHLMLEVIDKDLIMHPQKGVEFYLLNGKRASTIRKLKLNDQITFGKTVLKIISFQETIIESKKEVLNKKLSAFIESNDPRLTVIEKLSIIMKQ